MIPLPDPPLRSGEVCLRPWRADDAPALVAAWSDPEIARWTGAAHRRQGVATAAARLLVGWATGPLGLRSVAARCDVANPASVAVARAAGAMVLL